jgi:hypothetical protein
VGDEEALRGILVGLDNSPDDVQGLGIGADLIRVLRQLRLAKDRLAAIDIELAALTETDIAMLKAKVDIAATRGLDLLAEMEPTLEEELAPFVRYMKKLRKERHLHDRSSQPRLSCSIEQIGSEENESRKFGCTRLCRSAWQRDSRESV